MKIDDNVSASNVGWPRTLGSHRQFKHSSKPGLVTVAGKAVGDVTPKMKASIFRQARLKK
ncbi:MAG: type II toxin-antitoxin system HicA family toxin [Gammaproteobacteria bacterium]